MDKEKIKEMISDIVQELDYDLWKEYFLEDYCEDPKEIKRSIKRLINIVEKHLSHLETRVEDAWDQGADYTQREAATHGMSWTSYARDANPYRGKCEHKIGPKIRKR